ncbi:MAG: transporter [Phenylobacterium sp.]|nr:transporter [Phenylobacterium sp.]
MSRISQAAAAAEPAAADPAGAPLAARHVLAATIGNALEFYDFLTYAFFAIQIGHTFFPAHSEFGSLMLSLATFGAGFLTRPIGGFVIGAYADRVGRRAAMMLSLSLMGLSILALALIPSYRAIGVAAPILVLLARLVQGFSLGGEVGPNTAYLLEGAAPHRRGLVVSFQGVSQAVAAVTGAAVGLLLSAVLSHAALEAYGWRIAFLLGSAALPFGLMLRRTMPETLQREDPQAPAASSGATPARLARANARIMVLGLMVLAGGTIGTYVINYMTTFAQSTLHLGPGVAFLATLVPNVAMGVGVLAGGWLSDRLGRRALMIWPAVVHALLILPVFSWIVSTRSAAALLGGGVMLSLAGSLSMGGFYPAMTESLPRAIRGRSFATIYAVSIAIFGGTTQLVVTWLIHATGSPMAPAVYWLAAALVALAAKALILESAPARLPPLPVAGLA